VNTTLTAISGIRVGHAADVEAGTGCTVILCPANTVGGVDQRGGAPGTRETDLLRPMHLVQHVNAVLLAGGSAFGLAAADGVMAWLAERNIGYPAAGRVVPIVPTAILFDLDVGSAVRHPDAAMGRAACDAASSQPVEQGSVGAGTGAKVGQAAGLSRACKGGVGSSLHQLPDGSAIAALMAVNPLGDILAEDGHILVGLRSEQHPMRIEGTLNYLSRFAPRPDTPNTVIGVVATNAVLTKEQANALAQCAHDGIARAVQPAHTLYDGDTIFALATGEVETHNLFLLMAYAPIVVAEAIRNAVRSAHSLYGLPSFSQLIR
jgi:L-aminopeptidase/D-esterase-like protein